MHDRAPIEQIDQAFAETPYPGDQFLQGSFEGCEPYEEVAAFRGKRDWQQLAPAFLDRHYAALSFLSEAGFRFFLPAYLIADLRGQLHTADPVFHLTHGFSDHRIAIPGTGRVRRFGGAVLLNPIRYGAMTFRDHARYRLSVFTREEAGAIAAYLEHRRDGNTLDSSKADIDAALDAFWRDRAETAPRAADLEQHLAEERDLQAAICSREE